MFPPAPTIPDIIPSAFGSTKGTTLKVAPSAIITKSPNIKVIAMVAGKLAIRDQSTNELPSSKRTNESQ
eukprot:TRINITY_DN13967_c0_g1_i1.p2 TRINITY_DN13967_c0_g1~~TRINITY_DN13967_c0_g1_i1.p2  ORF type:complete len:69 (+),score=9.94 TRINITY_DN13967_c0_g1_i1:326-532(+)